MTSTPTLSSVCIGSSSTVGARVHFGDADTLSRAKGTSVDGMRDAGVVESGGGMVRLRKWSEYPPTGTRRTDTRLPVWEALHQLIRTLKNEGETGAGALLAATKASPKQLANWRIASIPSVNAKAGPRMPVPTTN